MFVPFHAVFNLLSSCGGGKSQSFFNFTLHAGYFNNVSTLHNNYFCSAGALFNTSSFRFSFFVYYLCFYRTSVLASASSGQYQYL